ncbi:hypothetical protein F441_21080 [Phytophthora nicotianae CJ01A1]|uniref:Uncharacterized protein n=2 Tax=Phytophthora nicotianae TaxID=4792 RepID=W2VTU1_PHYNI|nr:hypothetical protein L916_20476 [Phytophthora nicotianae]ETP01727.1 hypothetical protein F441_21080 [Phytophthora nicotianae CJ01A1]
MLPAGLRESIEIPIVETGPGLPRIQLDDCSIAEHSVEQFQSPGHARKINPEQTHEPSWEVSPVKPNVSIQQSEEIKERVTVEGESSEIVV